MRQEERELFKIPFELSLRERVIKITNAPYNVRKGELVKKADVNHQTFLNFMNDVRETKTRVLASLSKVVGEYEEQLGI
jgi:hypothetical protein